MCSIESEAVEGEVGLHKLANTYVGLRLCPLLVVRTGGTESHFQTPGKFCLQWTFLSSQHTYAHVHTHHQVLDIHSDVSPLKMDPFLFTEEELKASEPMRLPLGGGRPELHADGHCWTPTKSDIRDYSTCCMNIQGA